MQQYLVRLDNSIVSQLNAVLGTEDAQRRADFQGTKVAEAEYGMLVEDMRKSLFSPSFTPSAFLPSLLPLCR